MCVSSFGYATGIPSNHPKLTDYYAARYVRLTYSASVYHIDFKEVQAVLWDGNGHISLELAPTSKGDWGKNAWWIIFKNGRYVMVDSLSEQSIKWDTYKNFMKNNPQFHSIP